MYLSSMITAFFKPKSSKKVTPDDPPKRPMEDGATLSNKRPKNASENEDAVQELLSYLQVCERKGSATTWHDVLERHSQTASFARLAAFVASER
jgi:hypothetical protein